MSLRVIVKGEERWVQRRWWGVILMEEEVVEELEVKVGVVVREEVRVDMVVAHRPPEREGKFEFTLSSPLTSISQMRKLRPLRILGF